MKGRHRHAVLAALAAGSVIVAPLAHASDDVAAPSPAEDVKRPAAKPALDRSGKKRVGVASVYAHRFVGRKMADGTRMSADRDNAASRTLPLGTEARVTNLKTGQSAKVTIQDRGPYAKGRIVDLSPATADQLGITRKEGVAKVEVKPIALPPPDHDGQR